MCPVLCPRQGLNDRPFCLAEYHHSWPVRSCRLGLGPQLWALTSSLHPSHPLTLLPSPDLAFQSHTSPWGQEIVPLGIHVELLAREPSVHMPMALSPKRGAQRRQKEPDPGHWWAARVQGAGRGLTRHPQECRRAGCGAAAGVPPCLSAPHTWIQGPSVWAGGGSWPCPRAASGPRTLLPALQLWCSTGVGGAGGHPGWKKVSGWGHTRPLYAGWPTLPGRRSGPGGRVATATPRSAAETCLLRTKVSAQTLHESL